MASGRPFWDELVYRYQMGVQYVTWLRETWETLQPSVGARRFAEVRGEARPARGGRDHLARHERQLLARVQRAARCRSTAAPLSLAVTVGGVERRGFDLSASSYSIPGAITAVRALDPAARAELVSQSETQAVVKESRRPTSSARS